MRRRCTGRGRHNARQGERKDLVDITSEVDNYAATALLRNVKISWPRSQEHIETYVKDQLSKREASTLEGIIVGSICANDRFVHIKRVDDTICKCGCPKQTVEHIFWECIFPQIANIRNIYRPIVEELSQLLRCYHPNVLATKSFRCNGLMEEDYRVIDGEADLVTPVNDPVAQPLLACFTIIILEWWQNGFRRAFSDGARHNPKDDRLGRAAYAVFYGFDHPWNTSAPIQGIDQSAYRSELRGVISAIEHADIPTWVTLDNKAVCDTAALLCRGLVADTTRMSSSDHWERLRTAILRRPIGFFKVSWIKGHLDKYPEYIIQGLFIQQEADWHIECDKIASTESNKHRLPNHVQAEECAQLRIKLSLVVHSMDVDIWRCAVQHLDVVSETLAKWLLDPNPTPSGPRAALHARCSVPSEAPAAAPAPDPGVVALLLRRARALGEGRAGEVGLALAPSERFSFLKELYPAYSWGIPSLGNCRRRPSAPYKNHLEPS